jgi:hypothetical protein
MELPRETNREVANVDHFLDFAEALLEDLPSFERDQPRQRLLCGPQLFANKPHQLAPARRRDRPPPQEGFLSLSGRVARISDLDPPEFTSVDRRVASKFA